MFISTSPSIVPSNRFDMLDPTDHNQSLNNTQFPINEYEEQQNFESQQPPSPPQQQRESESIFKEDEDSLQQQMQESFPLFQYQQPFMSTTNYLLDESVQENEDNYQLLSGGDLDSTSSFTTNSLANINSNSLYGNSINVNLGAVPTNLSNPDTMIAGQLSSSVSSSYYNTPFNQQQQTSQSLQSFQPFQLPNDSSTSSSLYSYASASASASAPQPQVHPRQEQMNTGSSFGFSSTPTQSTFTHTSANTPLQQQQHDLYPVSNSMNSILDNSNLVYHPAKFEVSSNIINPAIQQQSLNLDLTQAYPQPPLSSTSTTFDPITYNSSPTISQPQFTSQSLPNLSSANTGKKTTSKRTKSRTPTTTSRSAPSVIKKEETNAFKISTHAIAKQENDSSSLPSGNRRYRVIRGISAGGCNTKPPKESMEGKAIYYPMNLNLNGASLKDICYPKWNESEKQDRRRIIRIERIQQGPVITANFSIVGAANENPVVLPPSNPIIDVIEVSCLECDVKINNSHVSDGSNFYDSQSSDDEITGNQGDASGVGGRKSPNYIKNEFNDDYYQYYITSVEVVEIVELLIGNQFRDAAERRKERGRVRSNLVPFWSKKPISSRMSESSTSSSSPQNTSTTPGSSSSLSGTTTTTVGGAGSSLTNHDYRVELAKRIMGYEIRKPRGFDKEVRILRWDKLVPALQRALQSYYTEIPADDPYAEYYKTHAPQIHNN
ncbi:conserved hypothetical protein [Candida dubliniensis CD36]|uniref:Uncharacterized protein n=1 Tax=Candida dubliniensis (strain CD36 / ATCC MYA-646 / CBS 7987 / NCPF 3949 / NRRL Y-17841) TaxID=573826 RepID=B9W6U4_CANDC|nr:conserved hypothetical protein [Candida dubliniensis CD36]CAX44400.1 conserved hypothetical protein [Candida dubliniensis CD36]